MPHVPLKVLRGEEDKEDVQDKYFDKFQAPGTSTEDAEDIDDDSRTSSLSCDNVIIGEAGEEGMARHMGECTGSVESVTWPGFQNYQSEKTQENPECNTTESANDETVYAEVVAQVHRVPSRNETKTDSLLNDDTAPLLTNVH